MALHLSLVLHELCTNATKYGALSTPTGKVAVEWSLRDGLTIRWTERGGPEVQPAASQGFGTTLITQSVKGQGGTVNMQADPEGISWEVVLPYSGGGRKEKAPQSAAPASSAAGNAAVGDLRGRRLLVVEDEPLIGMEIVAALEEAGAQVEGPISTIDEACDLINRHRFDAALLDANLHGCPVGPIAAALTRHKVPFAFATGYDKDGLPEEFREIPILGKPCGAEQVVAIAARLLSPGIESQYR